MTRMAVVLALVATLSGCKRSSQNEEPASEGAREDPSMPGRPAEQPGMAPVPGQDTTGQGTTGQGTPGDQAAGWRGGNDAGSATPPGVTGAPLPGATAAPTPGEQGTRGSGSDGDGGTRR